MNQTNTSVSIISTGIVSGIGKTDMITSTN